MFAHLIELWSEDLAWVWISAVPRQALLILAVALVLRAFPRMAAAWRHWTWLVAALAVGLIPLAASLLPSWPLIPAEWIYGTDAVSISEASKPQWALLTEPPSASWSIESSGWGWVEIAFIIWIVGALALIARLWAGLLGLRSFQRGRTPVYRGRLCARLEHCRRLAGVSTLVDLYLSSRSPLPMTWGVIRPAINLPEEAEGWSNERLDAVFLHELAHIQRADCWANMVLKMVCALNWFHPFVWMAARRTYLAQEVACDDFACARLRPSNYARHLVELTAVVEDFHRREIEPAVGLSSCDHLRLRVASVLDPTRSRAALPGRAASLMSGLVVLPMLLVAMISLRFVDETRAEAVSDPLGTDRAHQGEESPSQALDTSFAEHPFDLTRLFEPLSGSLPRFDYQSHTLNTSDKDQSAPMMETSPTSKVSAPTVSAPDPSAHAEAEASSTPPPPFARPIVAAKVIGPPMAPLVVPAKLRQVRPIRFDESTVNWREFQRRPGERRRRSVVLNHAQSVCNRYARLSPTDQSKVSFRRYLRNHGIQLSDAGILRLLESTRTGM